MWVGGWVGGMERGGVSAARRLADNLVAVLHPGAAWEVCLHPGNTQTRALKRYKNAIKAFGAGSPGLQWGVGPLVTTSF